MACSLLDYLGDGCPTCATCVTPEALARAFALSAEPIAVVRADGCVARVNPAFERALGYANEELCARPALRLVHPDDRRATLREWLALVREGGPRWLETRCVRQDGVHRWLSWKCTPADGTAAGEAGVVYVVGRDVSEWVRAEGRLRASERRFRAILDTVRSVAVCLNIDGTIAYCNDALLALTGWRREELIGRNWFERMAPGDAARRRTFEEAMAHGGVAPHLESELVTRGGERRQMSWDVTLLRDASGGLIGVASIGRDVTEEPRPAGEGPAGAAAHELSGVLATIGQSAERLLAELDSGRPRRAAVEEIRAAAERASLLARRLLAG